MSREEVQFHLRYAVRVLERHERLWARIDTATKMAALLAGSGVVFALGAQSPAFALASGALFAVMQAVEFALRPDARSTAARSSRAAYSAAYVDAREMDDAELARAWARAVKADQVVVSEPLRRLAFNDCVEEFARDPAGRYARTEIALWARLLA